MSEPQTYKERQRKYKLPIQYALFKGVKGNFGALRLTLKKAYQDERRDRDDGVIFLEMAPAIGPNNYDWENGKIIMALSVSDIPKIILYLRAYNHDIFQGEKADGKLKLYHDRGAGTSTRGQHTTSLTVHKPKGKDSFFFSMSENKEGQRKEASIPVSPDEAIAIGTLLQTAIPLILAWN